jgi:hypothetical protein
MMTAMEPFETISQDVQFRWDDEGGGGWDSLDSWASPIAGVDLVGDPVDAMLFKYRRPYTHGRTPDELASAGFGMLKGFVELSNGQNPAADGRLFRFASRYGSLGLCKAHRWPYAHCRPYCPTDSIPTLDGGGAPNGWQSVERIRDWCYFSVLARAIIIVASIKGAPEPPIATAALRAFIGEKQGGQELPTAELPYRAILKWLSGGDVRLAFKAQPRGLALQGHPPTWTALGLELARYVTHAKGITICASCGSFNSAKRLRKDDARRSYCTQCYNKGRWRINQADYRKRQKQARELSAQGKSAEEIARALGMDSGATSVARVGRYIKRKK